MVGVRYSLLATELGKSLRGLKINKNMFQGFKNMQNIYGVVTATKQIVEKIVLHISVSLRPFKTCRTSYFIFDYSKSL